MALFSASRGRRDRRLGPRVGRADCACCCGRNYRCCCCCCCCCCCYCCCRCRCCCLLLSRSRSLARLPLAVARLPRRVADGGEPKAALSIQPVAAASSSGRRHVSPACRRLLAPPELSAGPLVFRWTGGFSIYFIFSAEAGAVSCPRRPYVVRIFPLSFRGSIFSSSTDGRTQSRFGSVRTRALPTGPRSASAAWAWPDLPLSRRDEFARQRAGGRAAERGGPADGWFGSSGLGWALCSYIHTPCLLALLPDRSDESERRRLSHLGGRPLNRIRLVRCEFFLFPFSFFPFPFPFFLFLFPFFSPCYISVWGISFLSDRIEPHLVRSIHVPSTTLVGHTLSLAASFLFFSYSPSFFLLLVSRRCSPRPSSSVNREK